MLRSTAELQKAKGCPSAQSSAAREFVEDGLQHTAEQQQYGLMAHIAIALLQHAAHISQNSYCESAILNSPFAKPICISLLAS